MFFSCMVDYAVVTVYNKKSNESLIARNDRGCRKKVKFMKIAFFISILIQKKNLCQRLKKKEP